MVRRPILRKILYNCLQDDADFVAFCVDYCPETDGRFSSGMDRQQKINWLFLQIQEVDLLKRLQQWAADHGRLLPVLDTPKPEDSVGSPSGREGHSDRLLRRVMDACRLREQSHAVEIEPLLVSPTLHLCEVSYREGKVEVRYGLGATRTEVDAAILQQFEVALHTYCLDTRGCGLPRLVYHSSLPSCAVEDDAASRLIDLKSLDDYESLVDFTTARRAQNQRLAADPRYQPALYVPQRMRFGSGTSLKLDQHSSHALDTLAGWVRAPGNRCVLILGEFGTGKTFLLYELTRRLSVPGSKQVPLLCSLREIEKAQELDTLLVQHMQREQIIPIDPHGLRHMIGLGRVVLLFDGFDELALRTDYERAVHHLEVLLDAVPPGTDAKLLLTSRTSHFLTDQQVATILGQKLGRVPTTVAQLQPFESDQIEQFLANQLGSTQAARARCALLSQIEDLTGLATNPRMLGMIAQLEEARLIQARDRLGSVTEADLYQLLIEQWLDFEVKRKAERAAGKVLDRPQLQAGATQLALKLWRQIAPTLSLDDLREAVRASQPPPELDIEIGAQQLGSSSLLVRAGEAAFAFLHASLGEFLVARAAADQLQHGKSGLLAERPLGRLGMKFLVGCLRPCTAVGPVANWAAGVLRADPEPPPAAVENALQTFIELQIDPPAALDLSGKDLSGKDLSHLELRRSRLRGTILRKATLYRKNLRSADLRRADLRGADLRRANLQKANLTNAILDEANLLGADLRGASLDGARLQDAKLFAARIDEGALYRCDTLGAALPGVSPRPHLDTKRLQYAGELYSVAFSPDGKVLATGSWDQKVRLWSVHTGQLLSVLSGHWGLVLSVTFSPDGKTLASGGEDGTIHLWQMDSDDPCAVYDGHFSKVWSVAFSPDGKTLASGASDGTVLIWGVDDEEMRRVSPKQQGEVRSVAFSPDGQTLAIGASDGTIRLWITKTGQFTRRLSGLQQPISSVAFSPDGNTLAIGSGDGTIQFWSVHTGRRDGELTGHKRPVSSVVFSPDGGMLASASEDGTARLWRVDGKRQLAVLSGHCSEVWSVAFSPDGKTLATSSDDGTGRLWRIADGTSRVVLAALGEDWVAFTMDGHYKFGGDQAQIGQWFGHTSGRCRFQLGELDEFAPDLHLADDHRF